MKPTQLCSGGKASPANMKEKGKHFSHTQVGSFEKESLAEEELALTAPEFFPNILLIDEPIISFLKAFLKLNK